MKKLRNDHNPEEKCTGDLHLQIMGICRSSGQSSMDHCASAPHRFETNGIAERAVRRVNEGTWTIVLQTGLDELWWADPMKCYCYSRTV